MELLPPQTELPAEPPITHLLPRYLYSDCAGERTTNTCTACRATAVWFTGSGFSFCTFTYKYRRIPAEFICWSASGCDVRLMLQARTRPSLSPWASRPENYHSEFVLGVKHTLFIPLCMLFSTFTYDRESLHSKHKHVTNLIRKSTQSTVPELSVVSFELPQEIELPSCCSVNRVLELWHDQCHKAESIWSFQSGLRLYLSNDVSFKLKKKTCCFTFISDVSHSLESSHLLCGERNVLSYECSKVKNSLIKCYVLLTKGETLSVN